MEHEETSFVVVATVVAYLTPDWQQARELSYIAVKESVVNRLSNHAARRWMDRDDSSLSNLPFVDKAVFSENIRTLHCQPLHPLTAYTDALKAMEARPAQGQGTHYGIGGKTDQAWALKRSKSIWNAIWLCKRFLASVWDQEPVDLQSPYSVQAEPRPVTDSTKIQRGLRNNTPNSDAESGPKSKQRDIIRNGRVSHNCPPEGDNSACYASIRRSPRKATPGERSYVPAANSGSSSLKRREPGGSPDAECSPLQPKRQCPEPDTSHDLARSVDSG
jgi:hypothetical protein